MLAPDPYAHDLSVAHKKQSVVGRLISNKKTKKRKIRKNRKRRKRRRADAKTKREWL